MLKIDQSATPSLYGNNQAAFSVRLDAAGVTTIEKSLDGEILPIAVIYSPNYLGLRPAYSVRLSIDWDRVQKHMDERFSAGFLFSSVEIANAVDELVESRVIVLEADTFVVEDEDNRSITGRRDAALNQVRAMITDGFFQPTLPPIEPGKEEEWAKALRIASGVAGAIAGRAGGDGGVVHDPVLLFQVHLRADRPQVAQRELLRAGDGAADRSIPRAT